MLLTLNFDSKVKPAIQNICPQANIVSNMNSLRQKRKELAFEAKQPYFYIYI